MSNKVYPDAAKALEGVLFDGTWCSRERSITMRFTRQAST